MKSKIVNGINVIQIGRIYVESNSGDIKQLEKIFNKIVKKHKELIKQEINFLDNREMFG